MSLNSIVVVVFCLSISCVSFLTNDVHGQPDQKTIRFIGDVLVGTEFETRKDQVSMRWATRPRLSTFGPGSHHPTMVKRIVNELNECLPERVQIQVLSPNDESATLKIYFVPFAEFKNVAQQNGFENLSNNWGYFRVAWNGDYQLIRSTVLISSDKLRGRRLEHYLLEEITQSMGLGGDSVHFPDSVFYENLEDKRKFGKLGTATSLTKLDRQLIKFLYSHCPPGTPPVEIGVLLARHWN